jgi:ketosteroid isomerase-like protein
MLSYADAPVPILAGFAESHQRFWDRLARPGTGWTRAERVTTPREARAAARRAQCCERRSALSPRIVADPHTTVTDLPDAAVEVAHAVTRDAVRLTGRWYESRLVDGLSDGQYVEIVGTVVALVSIDQFCRAVAVPEHPLPAPLPRAPTRYRRPCLAAP